MTIPLPSALQAKDQARRLRARLTAEGTPIGHARSLELVAHQHGFRDWNTMRAAIGTGRAQDLAVGDRVRGRYLSHPFTARVVSVARPRPGWLRLELHLDQAVDVVASESFSNYRTRIRGVVGPKGHSAERTSDGQPHLQIEVWS